MKPGFSAGGDGVYAIVAKMLDLFAPIMVNTPTGSDTVTVTPDYDLLYETTLERGDYNYQFAAKIVITF